MAGHVTKSLYLTAEQAPIVDTVLDWQVEEAAKKGYKVSKTGQLGALILMACRLVRPDLFGEAKTQTQATTAKGKGKGKGK